MSHRSGSLGVLAGAALMAWGAALPASASAQPCQGAPYQSIALFPAAPNALYDPSYLATLQDSALLFGSEDRDDAYDEWGALLVSGQPYFPGTSTATDCTVDNVTQTVRYTVLEIDGLQVRRTIRVSPDGFARFLDSVTNPGPADRIVDLGYGSWDALSTTGDLGSDSSTRIQASSSGDALAAEPANDTWIVSSDTSPDTTGDPVIAHVIDGDGAPVTVDHTYGGYTGTTTWADNDDAPRFLYDGVAIAAGATATFLHLEALRPTIADAQSAATSLAAGPPTVFAGLTKAELLALRNWTTTDADADGIPNTTDNCATTANPGQADADADGLGDACDPPVSDPDPDKDTLDDAAEAARGTDRLKADTDADGIRDDADACPTVAGKGANGCPRFDVDTDTTAPGLTVGAIRTGATTRKALIKGLKVKITATEAATVLVKLTGVVKRATLARARATLASRTLSVGAAGSFTTTLKPPKALVRKQAKLSLVVTATDRAGNTKTITRSLRVR
jgi:hypothetical protein